MYSDWTRFWGNKSTKQLPNLTLWWRMYDWWTRPDQIQMSWTSNLITTATCDRRNYKCLDVVLAHQLATRHCNRIHLTQQEQKVSRTKAILLPGFDYLKQKHFLAFQFNNTLYLPVLWRFFNFDSSCHLWFISSSEEQWPEKLQMAPWSCPRQLELKLSWGTVPQSPVGNYSDWSISFAR